jgi:hypothetical protein
MSIWRHGFSPLAPAPVALLALSFSLAFMAAVNMALATPLTEQQCEVLRERLAELDNDGMADYVARGPEFAAQAGTGAGSRRGAAEVAAYLELVASIRFRCVGKKGENGFARQVPLPVRNSRRLRRAGAEAKKTKKRSGAGGKRLRAKPSPPLRRGLVPLPGGINYDPLAVGAVGGDSSKKPKR